MQKRIIISIIVILILIGGLFWWWEKRKPKTLADYIIVKETPEGKIVENTKEKISIKVPEDWRVSKELISSEKFSEEMKITKPFTKNGIENPALGSKFSVICYFNPSKESLKKWVQNQGYKNIKFITLYQKNMIRTEEKAIIAEDEEGNPIYGKDTLEVSYFFEKDDKICELYCGAAGPNYKEEIKKCEENIIKNFKF